MARKRKNRMRSGTLGFTQANGSLREDRVCARSNTVVVGVPSPIDSEERVYLVCGESIRSAFCLIGGLGLLLLGLNIWYFAWSD